MNKEQLLCELQFKALRSSGPGGQHVNKVASKIVLFWDISKTEQVNQEQKDLLLAKLKNRFNKEHVFQLECDTTRSQIKNKALAIDRFLDLITLALKVNKPRKETKTPRSVLRKRKENKEKCSLKKALRKRPLL